MMQGTKLKKKETQGSQGMLRTNSSEGKLGGTLSKRPSNPSEHDGATIVVQYQSATPDPRLNKIIHAEKMNLSILDKLAVGKSITLGAVDIDDETVVPSEDKRSRDTVL